MVRPTMEDVALRAGVSRALVSLVMRGSPKVSEMRRTAVLKAAEELGYSPHAMARSLASRTSTVLGVMVSDLHNAFFAEVVDGIDEVAREQGFDIIINTGGRSPARERRALESLLSFRPAGLILLSPVVPATAIGKAAEQLPIVLVARSSRVSTVDTVNDDGEQGVGPLLDPHRKIPRHFQRLQPVLDVDVEGVPHEVPDRGQHGGDHVGVLRRGAGSREVLQQQP